MVATTKAALPTATFLVSLILSSVMYFRLPDAPTTIEETGGAETTHRQYIEVTSNNNDHQEAVLDLTDTDELIDVPSQTVRPVSERTDIPITSSNTTPTTLPTEPLTPPTTLPTTPSTATHSTTPITPPTTAPTTHPTTHPTIHPTISPTQKHGRGENFTFLKVWGQSLEALFNNHWFQTFVVVVQFFAILYFIFTHSYPLFFPQQPPRDNRRSSRTPPDSHHHHHHHETQKKAELLEAELPNNLLEITKEAQPTLQHNAQPYTQPKTQITAAAVVERKSTEEAETKTVTAVAQTTTKTADTTTTNTTAESTTTTTATPHAEPISPRRTEPISPRHTEPISPRHTEPISPRHAEPISPRHATTTTTSPAHSTTVTTQPQLVEKVAMFSPDHHQPPEPQTNRHQQLELPANHETNQLEPIKETNSTLREMGQQVVSTNESDH